MKEGGIPVHVVREDAEERGISLGSLVKDFGVVGRSQLRDLFSLYDQVWHW
jgi:hypothetical protein